LVGAKQRDQPALTDDGVGDEQDGDQRQDIPTGASRCGRATRQRGHFVESIDDGAHGMDVRVPELGAEYKSTCTSRCGLTISGNAWQVQVRGGCVAQYRTWTKSTRKTGAAVERATPVDEDRVSGAARRTPLRVLAPLRARRSARVLCEPGCRWRRRSPGSVSETV